MSRFWRQIGHSNLGVRGHWTQGHLALELLLRNLLLLGSGLLVLKFNLERIALPLGDAIGNVKVVLVELPTT